MLTSRGWWFLFIVVLQTAAGLLLSDRTGPLIAVIGFILLAWFIIEWLTFLARAHFAVPQLKVRRKLKAERREVPIVWSNQEFEVVVETVLDSSIRLPYLTLQDRPPSGCERVEGRDDRTLGLDSETVAEIAYSLKCSVPGEIRFEGVRVQIGDLQGFFYHRKFIRQPMTYLVLPPLADAEGNRRTSKSHNILPPPGVHRLRRPGGGSELHDLRDYRPGDPPKMIAWKTSARRDRLITKEFENDVPVRCTLFVDASQSVRIGPARETMLNQITTIASGVSQAALADRDHVGLVLFDDKETEFLPPARTSRHLIELLHRLARANSAAPVSPAGDLDALMQLASPLGHELYPDLMDRRINQLPMGMFWEPLLDYRKAWIAFILLAPLAMLFGWIATLFLSYMFDFGEGIEWCSSSAVWVAETFGTLLWPIILAPALAAIAWLFWLIHGVSGQFPPWYTQRMRRKRLAALLAALDNAPVGTQGRYLDEDAPFTERLQQFLAEHHRRYPVALFDDQGRYLFRSEPKLEVLARAVLHSVARGRDNELFVILADLFELEDALAPLIKAVRVASARHHQVVVICPWMPNVPIVDERVDPTERAKQFRQFALGAGFRGIEAQLFRQLAERCHLAYQHLRKEFGKSGIMLVRAQQHESVRLILNRMDRLRGVRARR